MTEHEAKSHLIDMLRSFTTGSVLHLLADVQREAANEARRKNDTVFFEQLKSVESTLVVVGMGIDAARPMRE